MKRLALLLILAVTLCGCTKVEDVEYEPISLALPKKGTYFCPMRGYDGSYLLMEDIFDASEKCENWNNDFWKENKPEAYENCLEQKKLFVERFQQNTCVPVLKKNFTEGKSGCLVQVIEKYNKIIKYSCFGPDVDSVLKAIKKKYPQEEI